MSDKAFEEFKKEYQQKHPNMSETIYTPMEIAFTAGRLAEREECAILCWNLEGDFVGTGVATNFDCAEAIRRRG